MRASTPRPDLRGEERRDLVTLLLGTTLVVALGVVLGLQYLEPNPRVIAVLVAILMFGIAWRLNAISLIGVLVMLLPYPRSLVFGSTNLAFILLTLMIWLLRVSQRQSPGFVRTPIDAPLGAFLVVWIVSFLNIQDAHNLGIALNNTQMVLTGVVLYYMVTAIVRTEHDLRRLHVFQIASLVTIGLIVMYELSHPGGRLIPGWIEFKTRGEDFDRHNVRVGGPFFDFELLAEYSAISLLTVAFLVQRARSGTRRIVLGAIFVLAVFVLFATVTRGAMFALAAALLWLLWLLRRRIRVVPFTLLVTAIVVGFLGMNLFVSSFTRSGNIIERLMGTEFQGLVPDSRTKAWEDGFDQWMHSPVIGNGPSYRAQIGARLYLWPHNGYLYIASLVGALGLAAFVGILFTLWRATRPRVDRLDDPSYARAFLPIANAQIVLFVIDQSKIEFLRNPIYQFQVWLMFAMWMSAARLARAPDEAARTGA